jgi:hypothetical protein
VTTGEELPQKLDEQRPPIPACRRPSTWVQIAIVITAAVVLIGSSCAGMAITYENHQTLFVLATAGFMIGVVTVPVTIAWALIALIVELVRKRRSQA